MPLVVPRKVTFLAKSEYFTSPGLKGFIKKMTFIALGQVPVDRSGGRRSEAALLTGLDLLADGAGPTDTQCRKPCQSRRVYARWWHGYF